MARDEHYLDDFENLLKGYESIPSNKKEDFVKELSGCSFIDSINNKTGEKILMKPSQVYLRTKDLKEYFYDSGSVYFVSEELYEKFNGEKLSAFLMNLGSEDKPRRIEILTKLSEQEKTKLRGGENYSNEEEKQKDYKYDGLGSMLIQNFSKFNLAKSCLLWKLLLKTIENKTNFEAIKFFKGTYTWYYYKSHSNYFDAKFLKTLKQVKWLVDKKGNFREPSYITLEELSDDYMKEGNNLNVLTEVLGLLKSDTDSTRKLPEEDRKKLELTRGYTSEQLDEILKSHNDKDVEAKQSAKADWVPKYPPDKVLMPIIKVELEENKNLDLKGQSDELKKKTNESKIHEENKPREKNSGIISHASKKAIGDWGEKGVYLALKKEYENLGAIIETDFGFKSGEGIEIMWLNKNGNVGKGCDFIVRRNGKEIEYIEVKTTITGAEEPIEITGVQWEFARALYDQGEGKKYFIYVVPNAGNENAKIIQLPNPIKLWKDGKLYADPVNFYLPPPNIKSENANTEKIN